MCTSENTRDSRPAPLTSPCDGCRRPCNYTQCRPYRIWLNTCWNRYRRWQDLPETPPLPRPREDAWQYTSPVLIQDFLRRSPCERCGRKDICGDTQTCAAHTTWVSLRWERLRKKFGVS